VPEDRERAEPGRVRRHRRPEQGARSHRSDWIRSRQRAPRTSSLACS
jgi:hypothetical protein